MRWDTHQTTQSRVLQRSDNTSLVNQMSRNTQHATISTRTNTKKGIVSDLGIWRQSACFFLLWVNSLDETWHMMCHISKAGHQWSLLKGMDNRQIDMWMRWRGRWRWGGLRSDSCLSAITTEKIEEDLWHIMDQIAGWPSYTVYELLPPSCLLFQHPKRSWLTNQIFKDLIRFQFCFFHCSYQDLRHTCCFVPVSKLKSNFLRALLCGWSDLRITITFL